jgi:hypothetical protein
VSNSEEKPNDEEQPRTPDEGESDPSKIALLILGALVVLGICYALFLRP